MARRRYVGPEFWDSPTAVAVGYGARLTLIGCWTLADDEGLLLWDPATVRELLFDSDRDVSEPDVAGWMRQLVNTGAVVPFPAGKHRLRLAYIVGFERDHRTGRPKPSKYPAPPRTHVGLLAAYARRDGHVCHLCGGPLPVTGPVAVLGDSPATRSAENPENTENTESALGEGFDLTACQSMVRTRTEGGHRYPSNMAVAHAVCESMRADRTVDEVAGLVEFATVAAYARTVVTADKTADQTPAEESVEGLVEGLVGSVPTASQEVVEGPQGVVFAPSSGIAEVTEPNNAGLTTKSVSRTVLDSPTISEPEPAPPTGPLTCENADPDATHDELTESAVSVRGGLTTDSPTEVEKEEEKEREVEGLRASRACAASGAATVAESSPPSPAIGSPTDTRAFGAGQEEPATLGPASGAGPDRSPTHGTTTEDTTTEDTTTTTTSDGFTEPAVSTPTTGQTDLSGADVVLARDTTPTAHQPAGGDDMSPDESLFDVSADMVHTPDSLLVIPDDPEDWTDEQRAAAADKRAKALDVLNAWWAEYGTGWSQTYPTVHNAVMHALSKGISPATIGRRLAEHAANDEKITKATLGPKKPADPEYATKDRKELAHTILRPWWAMYGAGWPQTYAVVHRVLVSLLANNMTEDNIKQALRVLGKERKPISGGTVGFALSKSSSQVAEERAYEAKASSRSTDKYRHHTL